MGESSHLIYLYIHTLHIHLCIVLPFLVVPQIGQEYSVVEVLLRLAHLSHSFQLWRLLVSHSVAFVHEGSAQVRHQIGIY